MLKDRGILTKDLFLITDSEQLRKIKNQFFVKFSSANLGIITVFEDLIAFRKKISATKIYAPSLKKSKIDKYAEILSKFFADDGYRLGFIIHRNKFKKSFFEEYGENLTENDGQIDEIFC